MCHVSSDLYRNHLAYSDFLLILRVNSRQPFNTVSNTNEPGLRHPTLESRRGDAAAGCSGRGRTSGDAAFVVGGKPSQPITIDETSNGLRSQVFWQKRLVLPAVSSITEAPTSRLWFQESLVPIRNA